MQASLASILETQRTALFADATMNLLPSIESVPVTLEYSGELRAIQPETAGFLWQFETSFGDEGFAEQFVQELRVVESGQEFWLPVLESVPPRIQERASPGAPVGVSVQLLGSLQVDGEWRVIFVILGPEG
jgi:hypothetical protein